jgi:hypothetical protein
MAVSTIAGQYGGGIPLTCILKEGDITVTTRTYGPGGTFETGLTFASELRKGMLVSLSTDTGNTYAATEGLPVVTAPSNAVDTLIGIITSEPRLMTAPTTTQSTWSTMLSSKYYRVATVEIWGGITAIRAMKVICTTTPVVPGVTTTLSVDASDSAALYAPSLVDDTTAGLGFTPMHYCASGNTLTCLVGIHAQASVVT